MSRSQAGLEFQYEVCIKKFLGICTKHEMKRDFYDFNDPVVRNQLATMPFVCRVLENPI